jgi:hypothetical protein
MINTLTTNTISTAAGYNGVSSTYTISPPSYNMWDNILTVNGTDASLTVKGKCIINGRDLEERLDNIEKVLGIPEADGDMFTKYPSLKKKYDDYINELAKLRTWDALKG